MLILNVNMNFELEKRLLDNVTTAILICALTDMS